MRFFLAAFFSVFYLFSGQINIHASIATTPKNRIRAQNFFSHNRTGAEPASARKPRQLQALHSYEPASDRCDIRYTYDKASRISTVTIPAQHRELRYVYDGRGNKVNTYIRDTRNNRFTMQAFEYDALNRLTYAYSEYYGEVHIEYFDGEFTSTEELRRRVTYPSGIKAEFYHDAFDRPIRIAWIKDDNQIMAHSYEYDSFDRIVKKTVDSPSGQRQENYSFDLADRLIAALTPEGTINYDYDQNDNMTSIYHSGNTERQVNFATDNQYQELLTGVNYPAFGRSFTFGLDALGRRITDQNISNNALHVRTYAFDPMSRLSAVSSVQAPLPNAEPWPAEELEYSYLPGSPLRRTLTKQQPAQTTRRHFIWDGVNELESLSEFQEGGNTDYFAEIFLSDPAIMDKRFGAAKNLNAFVDEAAEGIDYITDQQNTINASYKNGNITDEQHFSPYGKPVTFTLPEGTELTKFAYTGRNYDAPADLYYYRGRYYDACSARFLNPDPAENGMNWTGYVGGDPINMVDPSGYFSFSNVGTNEEDRKDIAEFIGRLEKHQKDTIKKLANFIKDYENKSPRTSNVHPHTIERIRDALSLLYTGINVDVYYNSQDSNAGLAGRRKVPRSLFHKAPTQIFVQLNAAHNDLGSLVHEAVHYSQYAQDLGQRTFGLYPSTETPDSEFPLIGAPTPKFNADIWQAHLLEKFIEEYILRTPTPSDACVKPILEGL